MAPKDTESDELQEPEGTESYELQERKESFKIESDIVYSTDRAYNIGRSYVAGWISDTTQSNLARPKRIALPETSGRILDVCTTGSDTCILTEQGLFGFGQNKWGALGLGHLRPVTNPTPLTLPAYDTTPIKKILALKDEFIILTEKTLHIFGHPAYTGLTPPNPEYFKRRRSIHLPDGAGNILDIYTFRLYQFSQLLIQTENGVYFYHEQTNDLSAQAYTLPALPQHTFVNQLLITDLGYVVIDTNQGLFLYANQYKLSNRPSDAWLGFQAALFPIDIDEIHQVIETPLGLIIRKGTDWYHLRININRTTGEPDPCTTEPVTPESLGLPNTVNTIHGFKSLGSSCACVILTDQGVHYAGSENIFRDLFDLDLTSSPCLLPPPVDDEFVGIFSYNLEKNLFFLTKTRLYAVGNNRFGQLGLGHTNRVSTLTEVSLPCQADEIEDIMFREIWGRGKGYPTVNNIDVIIKTRDMLYRRMPLERCQQTTGPYFEPYLLREELVPEQYEPLERLIEDKISTINDPALNLLNEALQEFKTQAQYHIAAPKNNLPPGTEVRGRQELVICRQLQKEFIAYLDAREEDPLQANHDFKATFDAQLSHAAETLQLYPLSKPAFRLFASPDPIDTIQQAADAVFTVDESLEP